MYNNYIVSVHVTNSIKFSSDTASSYTASYLHKFRTPKSEKENHNNYTHVHVANTGTSALTDM